MDRLRRVERALTPRPPVVTPPPTPAACSSLPQFRLRDGLELPPIGLGCGYNPSDPEIVEKGRVMIETALDCGYRHFDTAQRYGTEPTVGRALAARIAAGSLRRSDVWITTKVANPRPAFPGSGMAIGGGINYMLRRDMDAYEGLRAEFAGCLDALQLDHVDVSAAASLPFHLRFCWPI